MVVVPGARSRTGPVLGRERHAASSELGQIPDVDLEKEPNETRQMILYRAQHIHLITEPVTGPPWTDHPVHARHAARVAMVRRRNWPSLWQLESPSRLVRDIIPLYTSGLLFLFDTPPIRQDRECNEFELLRETDLCGEDTSNITRARHKRPSSTSTGTHRPCYGSLSQ